MLKELLNEEELLKSFFGNDSGPDVLTQVLDYVDKCNGLRSTALSEEEYEIVQSVDGKRIKLSVADLTDVLSRADTDGKAFIQVNFSSGRKILLTDALIGFKPKAVPGLDLDNLPKVVTTSDLLSVFEAVEEAVSAEADPIEVDTLKKVFSAIVNGGEDIGFDLSSEKSWLSRLGGHQASA